MKQKLGICSQVTFRKLWPHSVYSYKQVEEVGQNDAGHVKYDGVLKDRLMEK